MLITNGEADIYLVAEEQFEYDACLIAAQPEFGHASFVALKGVIGSQEPVGFYLSKYHFQDPFNTITDFTKPGWPLYSVENGGKKWLIMVIETWMPTPITDNPQGTWIYSYPIARNFCALIKEHGVKELCYATATASNDAFPDDIFSQPKRTRVYEYHFKEGGSRTTKLAFMLPPSWLFSHLFTEMGGEGWIVFTGYKEDGVVDETATTTFANYFKNRLNLPVNRKSIDKITARIQEETEDTESMKKVVVDELMTKNAKITENDTMFG